MLPVVMCKEGKGEFNALETEEFGLFCTGDSCSTDGQCKTKWRAGSSFNSQFWIMSGIAAQLKRMLSVFRLELEVPTVSWNLQL